MTDETSAAPAAAAAPAAGARRPFFRRRKVCPFSGANAPKIDGRNVDPTYANAICTPMAACEFSAP